MNSSITSSMTSSVDTNGESQDWNKIWKSVYETLKEQIAPNLLSLWIDPLVYLRHETKEDKIEVTFSAANEFSADWVKDHYQDTIERLYGQILAQKVAIKFEVRAENSLRFSEPYEVSLAAQSDNRVEKNDLRTSHSRPSFLGTTRQVSSNIDPRYRFNDFIVGTSNQFAHASAFAVSEKPGTQYNPLFISSPPGLGKTHLLHAIGNHIMAGNKNARIFYISAENFMNELIESLQHRTMSEFRNKYRDSFDCILVDDIQFIAGKGKTEEEFFHTFNSLYGSHRQIVITSDRAPKEIEGLEERIRTRFEWGLVVDILPPEIETRIAILKAKAEKEDIYLPEDVAILIATHVKSNVRELEGTLVRLQAQASLSGAEITYEMAKSELKAVIPEENSTYTVESIQAAVVKYCGFKLQDLKGSKRTQSLARARQVAMYLVRKYTGLGYNQIGSYFGGKDHTTVLHAVKKIESAIEDDPEIQTLVEGIQNQL